MADRYESTAFAALPDGRTVRFGRIRPAARPQCLRFTKYLLRAGTPPPPSVDYTAKAMASLKKVYANDRYGCCVISDRFHKVGVWTGNDLGTPALGTDQEVVSQYQRICGPGDRGCVITDVLNYWRDRGIIVGGKVHKIDGYVLLDSRSQEEMQVAILLFGGATIGFNLPQAWVSNARDGAIWDLNVPLNIVGGHDVAIVGYNPTGVVVSTWGLVLTMTWRALASTSIVEEAYAELSPDWYNDDRLAPNGIDAVTLKADLAKLATGELPPWQPVPEPPQPPVPPTPGQVTINVPKAGTYVLQG